MGAALLRISKMQKKWQAKLTKSFQSKEAPGATLASKFKTWCEKYAMFLLPFITILREGLEAVIFIGGISLGVSASAIPIPTIAGILAGFFVGFLIYK